MAKDDNSVIFLKDWKVLIQSLSPENQLYFWELFTSYQHQSNQECDNDYVKPIWNFVKSQLDNMKEKYISNTVKTNQQNGALGGRPKKTQHNPNNPMGFSETQITPKDKDNNNNKDKGNVLSKPKKVFSPPSLIEVIEYFTEKGFNKDSAEKAFNYYDAGDWKDSKGNQVKNWKQKMQGVWFKDENKIKTQSEAQHTRRNPNLTMF